MNQPPSPPIACDLTRVPAERRDHFLAELRELLGAAIAVRELADGFAIEFPDSDGIAARLGEFIEYDRRCCPFMRHALVTEAMGGAIRLELGGVAEGRRALAAELGRYLPPGLSLPLEFQPSDRAR